MNWALEEAKKLNEKYPDREEFVIASGVSPSGFIHIGNFREKVKFILSFDDFDRFRKVPNGMPESYNKYIGMPYTSIPSPFNNDKIYAEEMEERFLGELGRLGIHPKSIFQTEKYKSGRYDEKIKLALEYRKQIYDIIAKCKCQ